MSEAPSMDTIVERIVGGDAPANVRSAAARGALPLPRTTLTRLFIHLLDDPVEEIRNAAKASLDQTDAGSVQEILQDPGCAAPVLDFYAKAASRDEKLAERIAFHPHVTPKALGELAAGGSASVIELVLTNQEQLLQHPAVLERLMGNAALRPDQQGRILELLDRAVKRRQKAEQQAGDDSAAASATTVEAEIDVEEAARLLAVDVGDLLSASEILGADELLASDDPQIRTVFQQIVTMNTSQKAILALKGGREERTILIRDTNKVVALGVLRNARLNESEVEAIARMRNVTDEVLRQVGNHREWAKNYKVVLGLINNPRTPQSVSANFVLRLTNRDLKALASSRDVPELIRRMAKRTHDTRTQKTSGPRKK